MEKILTASFWEDTTDPENGVVTCQAFYAGCAHRRRQQKLHIKARVRANSVAKVRDGKFRLKVEVASHLRSDNNTRRHKASLRLNRSFSHKSQILSLRNRTPTTRSRTSPPSSRLVEA